ncbi:GlxA family transcriptional regulator [Streptomyces sp. NPDC057702]|uniref:GlxA family transcriptional regulator n=1 Tax=unclassified Streptomyces TaxID=2593676 RepID=UPI0036CF9685
MRPGTVAVAVVEEFDLPLWDLYELAIACSVFGKAQPDLSDSWYTLRLCSPRPLPPERAAEATPAAAALEGTPFAPSLDGFALRTRYGLDALATADTVIVPSVPMSVVDGQAPVPPELVAALRLAAESGARMVSLCTGAFALAEAGLLDGRRATAHWMHTADLARRYPKVTVDDSVLYVDDGDVLTSAGMTAGLDLCLHLVRCDLGAGVAGQLARRMVVPAHRAGGQAQFIDLSVPESDEAGLGPVLEWAAERLHEPLTVPVLARRAGVSPRTFFRQLQAATGTTPLKWLLNQRLARAQTLLETTTLPIEQVAERSGLGSAANLRRHFGLHVGVPPREYRRAFAGARE